MNISDLYSLFKLHPKITTDSRNCPFGSIFFALKGASFDGNKFASQAIAKGCAFAIIDNPEYLLDSRTILFDDALRALQDLAKMHRKAMRTTVIAITGTNGKTTTKELIAAVLSTTYRTLYTQGNLNNHIGVPLTLLQLTREHEFAVIEMGASHPGDIRDLATIVAPDYGIITNIGQAHLEGFGSLEGVLRAKAELYDYIRRSKGKVFINQNDRALRSICTHLQKITYGYAHKEAPLVGGVLVSSEPYLSFKWKHRVKEFSEYRNQKFYLANTHLVGDYNMMNALAAIAVGMYFDVPPATINDAIETYQPSNNRSQLLRTKHNVLVIDAYNANPSSMRVAINNFNVSCGHPKALILGDMLELGDQSPTLHYEILQLVATGQFERVMLVGEKFGAAAGQFGSSAVGTGHKCFATVEELNEYISLHPIQSYNILIKGSHGMQLEKVIERL